MGQHAGVAAAPSLIFYLRDEEFFVFIHSDLHKARAFAERGLFVTESGDDVGHLV